MNRSYWEKKALGHERSAATLRAKYARTGEARWLKQARTNETHAVNIRLCIEANARKTLPKQCDNCGRMAITTTSSTDNGTVNLCDNCNN